MSDMSVPCGLETACSSSAFNTSKLISYLVLFLMTVLLPLWLIVLASSSVDVRKVSLSLKISEIDIWFDKLDADQSGELEIMEVSALLQQMGHKHLTQKHTEKAMLEIAQCSARASAAAKAEQMWMERLQQSSLPQPPSTTKPNPLVTLVRDDTLPTVAPRNVTREQFHLYFNHQIENMATTPYDILCESFVGRCPLCLL